MSDIQRLETLENAVRALHQELRQLREDVQRLGSVTGSAPAAPRPFLQETPAAAAAAERRTETRREADRAPRWTQSVDVEAVVGRYGTLALASLTVIMGVGAFLGWAISRHLLGPGARVALGAAGALGVGWLGWRLRERGSRQFGGTLLALSLALIQLDAWAAGPYLHVVPSGAALIVAAAASIALAVLALHEDEQILFGISLGGALLAPFVTSDSAGSVWLLLGYGWIILTSGLHVLRQRPWTRVLWIFTVGVAGYAAAGLQLAQPAGSGWMLIGAPAFFALCCAWAAILLVGPPQRVRLTMSYLGVAALALLAAALDHPASALPQQTALAMLGTVTVYAVLRAPELSLRWRFVGSVLLPVTFLLGALAGLPHAFTLHGALLAAAWAAVALGPTWSTEGDARSFHLMVAGGLTTVAIVLGLWRHEMACIIALSAHAALLALLVARPQARRLLWPVALDLLIASAWAFVLLQGAVGQVAHPFLNPPAITALAVVGAWWVVGLQLRRAGPREAAADDPVRNSLATLGALASFAWVQWQLAHSYSPARSAQLLIAYYAAVAITGVFVSRWLSLGWPRWAGLAVGLIGAFWSYALLLARPAYAYVPFATAPSVSMLVSSVGLWVVSLEAARLLRSEDDPTRRIPLAVVRALGVIATFFWWRAELAGAFSPEVAVFLLIAFYAAAGVALISLGRWRALPIARHAGLALALYAAVKAALEGWDLGMVGLRVGSLLLVGGFLFAVAYWYRAAGGERAVVGG